MNVVAAGEGCNSKGMFSSGVMARKAGLEERGRSHWLGETVVVCLVCCNRTHLS